MMKTYSRTIRKIPDSFSSSKPRSCRIRSAEPNRHTMMIYLCILNPTEIPKAYDKANWLFVLKKKKPSCLCTFRTNRFGWRSHGGSGGSIAFVHGFKLCNVDAAQSTSLTDGDSGLQRRDRRLATVDGECGSSVVHD